MSVVVERRTLTLSQPRVRPMVGEPVRLPLVDMMSRAGHDAHRSRREFEQAVRDARVTVAQRPLKPVDVQTLSQGNRVYLRHADTGALKPLRFSHLLSPRVAVCFPEGDDTPIRIAANELWE